MTISIRRTPKSIVDGVMASARDAWPALWERCACGNTCPPSRIPAGSVILVDDEDHEEAKDRMHDAEQSWIEISSGFLLGVVSHWVVMHRSDSDAMCLACGEALHTRVLAMRKEAAAMSIAHREIDRLRDEWRKTSASLARLNSEMAALQAWMASDGARALEAKERERIDLDQSLRVYRDAVDRLVTIKASLEARNSEWEQREAVRDAIVSGK